MSKYLYTHPNHECPTCGGPVGIPIVGNMTIPTFECMADDTHEPLKGEWVAVPREALEHYVETDGEADTELLDILFPPDHSNLRQEVYGAKREVAFVNTWGEFYDGAKAAVDGWALDKEIESLNPRSE